MGIKTLEKILEKKHKEQPADLADFSERKKLWLKSVKDFYQKVIEWLEPYKEKGLLKIDCKKITKNEQYIGEYEIDEMFLNISNEIVKFDPIGTFIIGAHGRIDMTGNNGTIRFVLVDSESEGPRFRVEIGTDTLSEKKFAWKISTSPPDIKYMPLNKNSFSDSLIEVIHD